MFEVESNCTSQVEGPSFLLQFLAMTSKAIPKSQTTEHPAGVQAEQVEYGGISMGVQKLKI